MTQLVMGFLCYTAQYYAVMTRAFWPYAVHITSLDEKSKGRHLWELPITTGFTHPLSL